MELFGAEQIAAASRAVAARHGLTRSGDVSVALAAAVGALDDSAVQEWATRAIEGELREARILVARYRTALRRIVECDHISCEASHEHIEIARKALDINGTEVA